MSIIGTDTSYQTGGPSIPSNTDLEQRASVLVSREQLGMMPDSLQSKLINTDETYRSGHFKLQAGKPSLAPLLTLRMDDARTEIPDNKWQAKYNELVQTLPPDIQRGLPNGKLTSNSYAGLDNLLQIAAKTLVWLEGLTLTPSPESIEETRAELNRLLPYIGLSGAAKSSEEVAQSLQGALTSLGRNNQDYDAVEQGLNDFTETLQPFAEVANRASTGQATKEDLQQMQDASTNLNNLIDRYSGRDQGGISTTLLPNLKTMASLTEAFSSPQTLSPSFLLSNNIVQKSLFGTNESAVASEAINKIVQSMQADSQVLAQLLVASTTVMALIREQNGLGNHPEKGEYSQDQGSIFDTQIALRTLLSTGIVNTLASTLASSANVPENGRAFYEASVSLAVILSGVIGGSKNEGEQTALLHDIAGFVLPHLQQIIASRQNINIDEDATDQDRTLDALLQQAASALDNSDAEGVIESFYSMLQSLGIDRETFSKDVDSLKNMARNLAEGIQGGITQNNSHPPDVAIAV